MFKCKLAPYHHVYDSMKGPKFDFGRFNKFDSILFAKCGTKLILLFQISQQFESIGRQNFHGGKNSIVICTYYSTFHNSCFMISEFERISVALEQSTYIRAVIMNSKN